MHTHDVFNQVPPIFPFDNSRNPALIEGLHREGAGWAEAEVRELGVLAGGTEAQEWGRLVNENPPVLYTHDRFGNRIDEVEFHPYWHNLMETAVAHGLHGAPWRDDRPGAHTARAAKLYAWGMSDAGHMCPISMTYAVVPALRHNPELAAKYEPLLASPVYDFGLREPSTKAGLIAGMSMTEKQGGSDVRANTTTATPLSDGTYRIVGHKWFTSHPMGDMFLTLAQAPGGLSCFMLPRVLPDGTRNARRIQRLKDKLGNKSNASSELEYENAIGWLVGQEGAGVKTIIEMVNMTRLDCVIGSATVMRTGAVFATHHARHRMVFGKHLVDQPAMRNVLADLVIESDAAATVMLRLAGATDRADADPAEAAFRRIALAVTKYWVCKRAPRTRPRPWNASAATATPRSRACRGCTARPRSCPSGRARAMWRRWMPCAPWAASPRRSRPSSPRSTWRAARTATWMRPSTESARSSPISPISNTVPGVWWS